MGTISLNGVSSDSIGIRVSTFPSYVYPEKNVETVTIPGRNGDVLYDFGTYKNVDISYEISVYQPAYGNALQMIEKVVKWMHPSNGYITIEDSYDPNYIRLGYCKNSGEVENILHQAGKATIKFNCRPEKFLKNAFSWSGSGTKTVSSGSTVSFINPGPYIANPKIKIVSGSSGATLNFNNDTAGKSCTLYIPGGYANSIVDCENLNAVDANGNEINWAVTVYWYNGRSNPPALWAGTTTIKANSATVQVMPRWWTL